MNVNWVVPAALNAPNDAVTPLGRLETVRATVFLNPLTAVIASVPLAASPWGSVNVAGWKDNVKFGVVTVRVTDVLLLRVPEVPIIVSE